MSIDWKTGTSWAAGFSSISMLSSEVCTRCIVLATSGAGMDPYWTETPCCAAKSSKSRASS